MTDTRDRIAERVHSHPGIHFNELVRVLDLAPGQVQYHLYRLRREGDIVRESLYGRTHYYPAGCDPWERQALALLRRETSADIVAYLLEMGESAPERVADELDIARSTLEWHLTRLIEADLVEKHHHEGNRVSLRTTRPTETVRLLHKADPSLFERIVDRFTRLVDGLLERE